MGLGHTTSLEDHVSLLYDCRSCSVPSDTGKLAVDEHWFIDMRLPWLYLPARHTFNGSSLSHVCFIHHILPGLFSCVGRSNQIAPLPICFQARSRHCCHNSFGHQDLQLAPPQHLRTHVKVMSPAVEIMRVSETWRSRDGQTDNVARRRGTPLGIKWGCCFLPIAELMSGIP